MILGLRFPILYGDRQGRDAVLAHYSVLVCIALSNDDSIRSIERSRGEHSQVQLHHSISDTVPLHSGIAVLLISCQVLLRNEWDSKVVITSL